MGAIIVLKILGDFADEPKKILELDEGKLTGNCYIQGQKHLHNQLFIYIYIYNIYIYIHEFHSIDFL